MYLDILSPSNHTASTFYCTSYIRQETFSIACATHFIYSPIKNTTRASSNALVTRIMYKLYYIYDLVHNMPMWTEVGSHTAATNVSLVSCTSVRSLLPEIVNVTLELAHGIAGVEQLREAAIKGVIQHFLQSTHKHKTHFCLQRNKNNKTKTHT